jgi:outer membrane receptor for ferrienterochelin and colicin
MYKTFLLCVTAAALAACATTTPATRTAAAGCLENSTASRIPKQCSASPVRTYSQEDVQRTGQTDVANALKMLDPSITLHH